MRKRFFGLALSTMLYALCLPVEAQQAEKVPRIGYLSGSPPSSITARTEAFRQGLRDLGYVEGKNIVIEWRSGEGKRDRFRALAGPAHWTAHAAGRPAHERILRVELALRAEPAANVRRLDGELGGRRAEHLHGEELLEAVRRLRRRP